MAYSVSAWVKRGAGARHAQLGLTGTLAYARVYFDLDAGTVATQVNGTGTIKAYPNGWYRITASGTSDLTGSNLAFFAITNATTSGSETYSGDGTSSIIWWGMQLEAAAFASSYIPTTTAAVTRNADVLTYATSEWLSSTGGTILVEAQRIAVLGSAAFALLGNGTDGISIETGSTSLIRLNVNSGGVNQALISGIGVAHSVNTTYRMAAAVADNDFAFCVNGGTVGTDASGTYPTFSGLNIGASGASFGPIARFAYWAQRLTNAQLQALSNGEDIGIEPDFDVNFATESLAVQTGNLDHARIGYHNPARDLTAVASSEEDDFPADAAQRPDTYESWKPATMPATWAIDFGETVAIDYVGIAAHELGTKGCTAKVQYSVDNAEWQDASDEATPADDSPMLLLFSPQAARYWRLYLAQAASPTDAPEVGVIYMGRILTMQRSIYGGHMPITLSRETVLHQSLSRGGNFLGQGFRRSGLVSQASFRHLTAAWYRENFDPFVLAARRYPYFFAWRPGTFADELAYAWTDEDIRPSNMGLRDFMTVSWPMRGFVHA